MFRRIERKLIGTIDWELIISVLLLGSIGLVILYSAGYQKDIGESPPMERQLITMGLGFFTFVVCMLLKTSFWWRSAIPLYLIGCGLLAVVLFTGVVAGGAGRWLQIGSIRIQPSEFMKLAFILMMAREFSREGAPRDGYTLSTLVRPCLIMLIPVELIRREPDLGTALCHLLIGGSMLLVVGIRGKTFLRLAGFGAILSIPAWQMLKDYQRQRILTFLSPESDPLGSGYHAIQSKIAVGSGMITGKGFLEGTQTQLRFLPEQTTDFIFSVLAEEWGFVGSLFVLGLYALIIYRLFRVAQKCADPFASLVSVGVAALLFWHIMINIGMVTGSMPVVGLTLPLLSFGGSSLITVMSALGIVVGFTVRTRYR